MEFKIPRETFYRALQKIQGIVEKRTTMPILSNALIEARENTIEVIATDLDVAMKSSYPANVISPGKITVAARSCAKSSRNSLTRRCSLPPGKMTGLTSAAARPSSIWWASRRTNFRHHGSGKTT